MKDIITSYLSEIKRILRIMGKSTHDFFERLTIIKIIQK